MKKVKISNGIIWLDIPEADLFVLCGCPADSIKFLKKKGFLKTRRLGGVTFEHGPNAILLSDTFIQNGSFANLAEFPVLQMLYKQGMILPDHPNNTGRKPLLMGTHKQLMAQSEYIYRGNYGLTSVEELMQAGLSRRDAEIINQIKRFFAFDHIRKTSELIDFVEIGDHFVEVRNNVFARRLGFNRYQFRHNNQCITIDLNLPPEKVYLSPFSLPETSIRREEFAIVHIGEGNGWDASRPCMSSIIVYKGEIYLIDAGPGIVHNLKALGLSINDIKGVFHTHAHDDHFAGFTDLIRADHRIQYFATPLVRASVVKKLTSLTGGFGADLDNYMEIHDLRQAEWNDLGGLEVKPILSPHPVETTVFFFRVKANGEYRTYAHLADIPSFSMLRKLAEQTITDPHHPGPHPDFFENIMKEFLTPVDIKKIDIGGGLIHGRASDFRDDRSGKIYLSHIDRKLTPDEKRIGESASFGQMDVLLPAKTNYLLNSAKIFLQQYFPSVSLDNLRPLTDSAIVTFNTNDILLEAGQDIQRVLLVLSGLVTFEDENQTNRNIFSANTMIGELPALLQRPSKRTYRALSPICALHIPADDYRHFVAQHNLLDRMVEIHRNRHFLQRCWLFGEMVSFPVQDRIARVIRWQHINRNSQVLMGKKPSLYLIDSGTCRLYYSNGTVENLSSGGFFGEETILGTVPTIREIWATTNVRLAIISGSALQGIPVLRWKLVEMFDKRQKRASLPKEFSNQKKKE